MVQSGLVGWWPLHEWSGRANDLSGNGRHGTNSNVSRGVAAPAALTGYGFNGSSSNVTISNFSYNEHTISGWIRPSDDGTGRGVIWLDKSSQHVQLGYDSDKLWYEIQGDDADSTIYNFFVPFEYDEWYHILGSWDGDIVRFYVNGELVGAQQTTEFNTVRGPDNTRDIKIGSDWNDTGPWLNGVAADIRLYNRTLSPSEVKTLYEKGSLDLATPPGIEDSAAVSRYSFDDRSDTTTALDEWGANNGAINGATYSSDAPRNDSLSMDFNGSNDEVDTTFTTLNLSATISLWIDMDSQQQSWLFSNYNSTGDDAELKVRSDANGNTPLWFSDNAPTVEGNTAVNSGWNHIAVTIGNGESTIYLNGVKENTESGTVPASIDNGSTFRIGAAPSGGSTSGRIDDVRLYSRVLSDSEVHALYRYGSPGVDRRSELVTR